jgi:hypothetical protein
VWDSFVVQVRVGAGGCLVVALANNMSHVAAAVSMKELGGPTAPHHAISIHTLRCAASQGRPMEAVHWVAHDHADTKGAAVSLTICARCYCLLLLLLLLHCCKGCPTLVL